MKRVVVAILPLLLVACGGGDGGDDEVAMPDDEMMPAEVMSLASDPRVLRLGGIAERTEALLMPGMHASYSVSAPDETITASVFQDISCAGAACAALGLTLDPTDSIAANLINPDSDIPVSDAELGSRGDGFDTASIKGYVPPWISGRFFPALRLTTFRRGWTTVSGVSTAWQACPS